MEVATKILCEFEKMYEESKTEHRKLTQELRKIELAIQDILHFIEFENFSASKGYQFTRVLKQLRMERRNVKNEMESLQLVIFSMKKINFVETNLKLKEKDFAQHNRKYNPRVIKHPENINYAIC